MAAPKKRTTKALPAASAKRAKAPRKAPSRVADKTLPKRAPKRPSKKARPVAKVKKPAKASPVVQPVPKLPEPPAAVPPFIPPILLEGDEPLLPLVVEKPTMESADLATAVPTVPPPPEPESEVRPPASAVALTLGDNVQDAAQAEPQAAWEPAPADAAATLAPEPTGPVAASAGDAGVDAGRPVPTPESLWEWHAPAPAPVSVSVGSATPGSRLTLTARDPRSLLADWWLSEGDANTVRTQSADHHLVLRIFASEVSLRLVAQIHLPSEWRSHPIEVSQAGASYMAELGLFDGAGNWVSLATAEAVTTPAEKAVERPQEPAGMPVGPPAQPAAILVRPVPSEPAPGPDYHTVAVSPMPVDPAGEAGGESVAPEAWNRLLRWLETEIGPLKAGLSSGAWQQQHGRVERPQTAGPGAGEESGAGAGPSGVSSHEFKQAPAKPRSFWFKVQADLVVHGATEPDAQVVVGGMPVTLRPDGTFTLRFALPDGKFALIAEATSADGLETRAARLHFERRTDYEGGTQEAPGDPQLTPPPSA